MSRVPYNDGPGLAVGSRGADHNRSGAYEVDFSAQADRLKGTPEAARLAVENRRFVQPSLLVVELLALTMRLRRGAEFRPLRPTGDAGQKLALSARGR